MKSDAHWLEKEKYSRSMKKNTKFLVEKYVLEIENDIKNGRIKKDSRGYFKKSKVFGDDSNGKRVRGYAYGNDVTECAKKLAEQHINFEKNHLSVIKKVRFRDVANEWFEEEIAYKDISQKNIATYRSNLKKHIIPYFGDIEINTLKPKDFQRFLYKFEGQGESHVKKIRMTINQIIKFAVLNEYMTISPFFKLNLPKCAENNKRDKLSDEELKIILKAVDKHKCGEMILIMLLCGLRPSEAIRLKWDDVNLDEKYLKVRVSKTKNGENRIIPIADIGITKLKQLKEKYKQADLPLKHVFHMQTDMSKQNNISTLETAFKSFIRTADILSGAKLYRNKIVESKFERKLTSYYLRHTFCSHLSLSGLNDYVIKRLMGHSLKDSITSGVYTHYTQEELLKASQPYIKYINKKIDSLMK